LLKAIQRNGVAYARELNQHLKLSLLDEKEVEFARKHGDDGDFGANKYAIESVASIHLLRGISVSSLIIEDCSEIDRIHSVPLSLRSLELKKCWSLRDINYLSGMQNLEVLYMSECNSLQGIEAIADLMSLRFLKMTGCKSLLNIRSLCYLRKCVVKLEGIPSSLYIPEGFYFKGKALTKDG